MRRLIVLAGALALALWLPIVPAAAQPLPPRPTPAPTATAAPTAEPTVEPTAEPEPEAESDDKREPAPAPGRITGTVIDQRTGAPAPGVQVRLGDELLTTDANGNYDRNGLAPGVYEVALVLAPEQGVALQGTLWLELAEGATVVQHLVFASPAPVEPTATAEPEAIPAPTAVPIPATLPATGGIAHNAWWPALIGLVMLAVGAAIRKRGGEGR